MAIVGLVFLPGCIHKSSREKERPIASAQVKEGVRMYVHEISGAEAKRAFGKDITVLGYQPLMMTIHNTTDDVYLLRSESIHMPLIDPEVVAQAAHYKGAFALTYISSYFSWLLFWPGLIPSVGCMYWMTKKNAEITAKTEEMALASHDSLDILPYERLSRIVFVPTDEYTGNFRMHLFNIHEKAFIPFSMHLAADDIYECDDAEPTSIT
jgi:hypothetical protein